MFINKAEGGRNNICGVAVAAIRKRMGCSQREIADMLQRIGLDVDKNAIQRIESGQRFVTDIELIYLCRVLHTTAEELLGAPDGLDSSKKKMYN